MKPKLIEVGMKFGKLTVVAFAECRTETGKSEDKTNFWTCICDCGEYKETTTYRLRKKITVRCDSCRNYRFVKENMKFNQLTTISIAYQKYKVNYWNCVCDCGKNTIVSVAKLRQGGTKSCGCAQSAQYFKSPKDLPYRRYFSIYKKNADKRNLSFNLTDEQFREITSKDCYFCGINPPPKNPYYDLKDGSFNFTKKVSKEVSDRYWINFNGIDRLDNGIGYEFDNCVPCCTTCNFMKTNMHYNDFINKCKQIANNFTLKGE